MIHPELEMPAVIGYNYAQPATIGVSHLDTFTNNPLLRRIGPGQHPWEINTWPDNTNWEDKLKETMQDIAKIKEEDMGTRRLVKVIIVDPNENVPLEDAVLYMGNEQLTDLTDEEIFYDLSIKEMITKHNETRTSILDKEASKSRDKDVFLEKIRIRDLKMVVLTIAQF